MQSRGIEEQSMHQRHRNKRQAGFTLVELMITVVVLGVLAAIAVPTFTGFIKKSKTSESGINVRAISNGAISWFNAPHNDEKGHEMPSHFPNTQSPFKVPSGVDTTPLPVAEPCANGVPQYKVDTSLAEKQPWKSIKFAIRRSHYYQYTYSTEGTQNDAYFAIRAMADIDCNKKFHSLILCAQVEPQTGEVQYSDMLELFGKADASILCKPSKAKPPAPKPS